MKSDSVFEKLDYDEIEALVVELRESIQQGETLEKIEEDRPELAAVLRKLVASDGLNS